MSRPSAKRPRRTLPALVPVLALVGVLALSTAAPAQATNPVTNPFFKVGADGGTSLLQGWATSGYPGSNAFRNCYQAGGDSVPCLQGQGMNPVAVVGGAGDSSPAGQTFYGPAGGSGNWQERWATDIYNGDSEWLAENPPGNAVDQQSNYALLSTGCNADRTSSIPTTVTSQPFSAQKDQVLTGYSFFSTNDWVPDHAEVTVTPQGGSPQTVFGARIASNNDLTPRDATDHPVPPTSYLFQGVWRLPNGAPANDSWASDHQSGVGGLPWTRWAYRFPADGTYTITATVTDGQDAAYSFIDCSKPSTLSLQFQTPTPIKDGLTVGTMPATATYGDAPFSIADKASVSASRTGEPNPTGKGVQFSTDDPDCSVSADGTVTINQVGDGTCDVTVRAPGNFYFYAPESKTLPITINPAPLHVDAPSLSKTFGAANPDPVAGYAPNTWLRGFVYGEDATSAGVTGAPVCSIAPGPGADAGIYAGAITCAPGDSHNGGLSASNYIIKAGSPGTLTITKANQTITLPGLANKTYGDGDVNPGATASSGLSVRYASSTTDVCTITGDGKIHIAHAGDCAIIAAQDGNNNYNPADPVVGTFTIAKADQAITFGALTDKGFGDADFNVNASAGSGLPVTYSSLNTDVCTVDSHTGLVQIVGAGACVIVASQGGNGDYNAAQDVARTFNVGTAGQTITFNAPANETYGDGDLDPGATASSGLPVSYTATGNCEIVNGKVHITGAGSCTVTASQGGNNTWNPAAPVSWTFQIDKALLTVTAQNKSKAYGDTNPSFSAQVSGYVNGDSQSGSPSCSSNATQGSGAGSYAITCGQGALQPGPNYDVKYVDGALAVSKATLTVTADNKSKTYGDPNPAFTSHVSGYVGTDSQSGSPSCSSNATQGSNVGSYAITCGQGALQPGPNYDVKYVDGMLNVSKANQSITFGSIDGKFFGQDDFNAGAGDTAGLPVTYSASGDCTVDPSTGKVHLQLPSQWPGNCAITASQGGNGNYNAAQPVTQSFKIATSALDGGGVFDIGNTNAFVGNNVTWWGAQWWKQNTLTGGSGPAEFKGFIDNSNGYPPKCGDTWTTRPGNSSKPPDSVPQYMTVVVSSGITKSGSTISGDIQTVVVVKTDSGYDSNPGHAGTGTVVAKLCGKKLDQSIAFDAPSSKTVADPDFDLGTSASSGLPVSLQSSTPSVCTIVSGMVHIVGTGNCTISASQGGNDLYNAASGVSRTFAVNAVPPIDCSNKKTKCESVLVSPKPGANAQVKAGQKLTIGYTDDSPIPTSGPLAPTAQLSDGRMLPVTVSSTSGLPYDYVTNYKQDRTDKNQSLLAFSLPSDLAPGNYSILVTANDGDGDVDQWNWPVTVVSAATKFDQTISFATPSDSSVTDPNFDPGASASSGLPVTYQSSTLGVCTIVSGQVHLTGAGTCTITASQSGSSDYKAATSVSRTFTVRPIEPVCTTGKPPKGSTAKCESLLINPSPGANALVPAGQKMTIGYTDDGPIGTGALAPTAQLSNGQLLPVTVAPTSGQSQNYVNGKNGSASTKYQSLLTFSLPSNLAPGNYSVLVTVSDDDGDQDQWNWPVRVS